jgi:hypothetical protein
MIKKVVLLGDSLSFSRIHKGQKFEDSWPYILAKDIDFSTFWNRAKGGSTTLDVLRDLTDLIGYYGESHVFDLIVVQVGIVDCCPRSIPRKLRPISDFIVNTPLVGSKLGFWFNKFYSLISPKIRINYPYIGPAEFKKNMDAIVEKSMLLAKNVILINIAKPDYYLVENALGVLDRWLKYSQIVNKTAVRFSAKVIEFPNDTSNFLLPDGHHLTCDGHRFLANKIKLAIEMM